MKIGGLLLAGGRSRRFGSEKAMAPVGDGLMMDIPLAALQRTCAAVAVSVRPGSGAETRARDLALTCLLDAPGDAEGPLAGIRRGLDWAASQGFDWLAVGPCDAPTLAPGHYRRLTETVCNGAAAAIGEGENGLEPLVSVWPVSSGRAAVAAALAAGGHPSIREVMAALAALPVRLTGYDGLNVNTPDDLTHAS